MHSKRMIKLLTFKNITIGGTILAALAVVGIYVSQMNAPALQEIHLQYPADFSDDRMLMGASHNVFVGKVLKQTGTTEMRKTPSTQFEVEVIENIKGDLEGSVTVDQLGGYKDGTLYLVHEDTLLPEEAGGTALLQPGLTYLFATRYNEENGQYVLITHPNGLTLISSDTTLSEVRLQEVATSDKKVRSFKEGYKNEILLDADIQHNNTRNSYRSLQ